MFSRLLPYLRLVRFSNAPTALADIVAGFLLGLGGLVASEGLFDTAGVSVLLSVILSSLCLYSWGMLLNDLYDFEQDSANRSTRPLPAGEISLTSARVLAVVLFVVAAVVLAFGLFSGGTGQTRGEATSYGFLVEPFGVFAILTLLIWLYDGPLKSTHLAPFVMGGCRGMNLLLGAVIPLSIGNVALLDAPADLWICVAANTAFVSGLTWYARREESGGLLWQLILGLVLMLSAYALLGFGLLSLADRPEIRLPVVKPSGIDWLWPFAVAVVAFPVIRKAIGGIVKPSPQTIKAAIIAALGNLVFINALICLYADRRNWWVAAAIASLIIPITFLKRFIPPT